MSEGRHPDDLRYTSEHEWARWDGDLVRVGITHFAQDQLGDVVYVDLPVAGAQVKRGQPFGEVESTKSVADLFAPVSGTLEERNEALEDQPELVNRDPYGAGWMIAIRPHDPGEFEELLTSDEYRGLIE